MRAGTFNINEYLNKLYEASESDEKEKKEDEAEESEEKKEKEADESEEKEEKEEKKPSSSKSSSEPAPKQSTPATKQSSPTSPKGGLGNTEEDGIIIPEQNKKFYSWLKGEYQKGRTEVKVEMKLGDTKFEPGYELQTDLDSVKDFKPGMFGEVKTADTKGSKTIGGNQPNISNQVTGLSKPAEEGNGQGKELQKSKAMTVKSEPTKPFAGGKPAKAEVGKKAAAPVAAKEPEEDAEIEKIDIKTKKEKNAK